MLTVTLSGGSGSGKTTLANQIVSKFPQGFISILPLDAYYKDHRFLSSEEKKHHNFDHPDAIDFDLLIEHIKKLKLSLPVERPVYSFATCSREEQTVAVAQSEILLVEGILSLADENLRNETDLRIFIETNDATRLERVIKRDMAERNRDLESVIERFYQTVQPMHEAFVEAYKSFADVVVDGSHLNIAAITASVVEVIGKYLYHENCQIAKSM